MPLSTVPKRCGFDTTVKEPFQGTTSDTYGIWESAGEKFEKAEGKKHAMDLFTWGAAIRFISRSRVWSGPSLGRLFLRASRRKAVHCCTIFCSMNTSTIWAVSASGSSSWDAILGRSILHQCGWYRYMTFWCGSGSGSADPCLWLMDPDPVLLSSLNLQDADKKFI